MSELAANNKDINETPWDSVSEIDDSEVEKDIQNIEKALDNYLESDTADTKAEIVERSPKITPFHLVGERDEANYDNSKVHFVIPGLFAGPNETFTPVYKAAEGKEDVYAPDRTGGFSAKNFLNGVLDVLDKNPNYQKINILSVSVGASIAKELEENPRVREMNESGREISLTFYDPFDISNFAFGANAKEDSVISKAARAGLWALSNVASWIKKPLELITLKKTGKMIGEDTSIGFLLGQFGALHNTHIYNKKTGKFYYEDHINGTIEAGSIDAKSGLPEDKENHDIFMEKDKRNSKFAEAGIGVYLHAGGHGATDDIFEEKPDSARKNPTNAYKQLLEDIGW